MGFLRLLTNARVMGGDVSAFASAAEFTLVTFDTGYARQKGIRLRLLSDK
jgi:hypothetical protein